MVVEVMVVGDYIVEKEYRSLQNLLKQGIGEDPL
jgi:hypothetical protein